MRESRVVDATGSEVTPPQAYLEVIDDLRCGFLSAPVEVVAQRHLADMFVVSEATRLLSRELASQASKSGGRFDVGPWCGLRRRRDGGRIGEPSFAGATGGGSRMAPFGFDLPGNSASPGGRWIPCLSGPLRMRRAGPRR